MKQLFVLFIVALITSQVIAQPGSSKYPDPEFSNEVYHYSKDSMKLQRLEKGISKMETKTRMGGIGGAENGYTIDGEKSTVRLINGTSLSFIISTGSAQKSSPTTDSVMRANGIDPSQLRSMESMDDPSRTISLYKTESNKGKRKVLLIKSPGALPFGSKKMKSGDKLSFSVRKIRDGYWELLPDKSLSKGEYAFVVQGMGMASMDGSVTVFAFAIE